MEIEVPINGTVAKRCKRIFFENPRGGTPSVSAIEELVIRDGAGVVLFRTQVGLLSDTFATLTTPFNLLNPVDDSVRSVKTYRDAYEMLYSLYRHLSNAANP